MVLGTGPITCNRMLLPGSRYKRRGALPAFKNDLASHEKTTTITTTVDT